MIEQRQIKQCLKTQLLKTYINELLVVGHRILKISLKETFNIYPLITRGIFFIFLFAGFCTANHGFRVPYVYKYIISLPEENLQMIRYFKNCIISAVSVHSPLPISTSPTLSNICHVFSIVFSTAT